jgi:hypothetical protein
MSGGFARVLIRGCEELPVLARFGSSCDCLQIMNSIWMLIRYPTFADAVALYIYHPVNFLVYALRPPLISLYLFDSSTVHTLAGHLLN